MEEPFANISDSGELMIDWETAVLLSNDFDAGDRDEDAAWGKMLTMIRRHAFEEGFLKGCAVDRSEASAWLAQVNETKGNA